MPEARATLVLVHGAWHGPWCWELLSPHLRGQALAVQTVELPSMTSAVPAGLPEDAAHLGEVLRQIAGPVILCGHSYGGMVVTATRTEQADVRHLVYLCAYMTEAGESVESSLRAAGERRPGHWIRRLPDGRNQVDRERAATLFYEDCAPALQDWALAQLRPQWAQCLVQPSGPPAWRRHPSTYVICTADMALSPHVQREAYAPRAQRIVTLPSGHSPFLSVPQQLAQVLVSACQ
jgi:pimeloyl-ACP methyl ester carboxylesterase